MSNILDEQKGCVISEEEFAKVTADIIKYIEETPLEQLMEELGYESNGESI